MPLYVYNLTGAPITLAAGNGPHAVVPASPNPPNLGPARDVTGSLRGLTSGDYTNLAAQQPGVLLYKWTDEPEFSVAPLAVAAGNFPAFTTNGSVIKQVGDGGPGTIAIFSRLTQDDIDPGFAVGGSFSNTGDVEVGSSVASVVASLSYTNGTPASASIASPLGTVILSSPYTSGTLSGPFTSNTVNAVQAMVASAIKDGTTRTLTNNRNYRARMYYGSATPAAYNAAFVQALVSNQLAAGFAGLYTMGTLGGTKKSYFWIPQSWGGPTIYKDNMTGFETPHSIVQAGITITNAFGVSIIGNLWASDEYLNAGYTLLLA